MTEYYGTGTELHNQDQPHKQTNYHPNIRYSNGSNNCNGGLQYKTSNKGNRNGKSKTKYGSSSVYTYYNTNRVDNKKFFN